MCLEICRDMLIKIFAFSSLSRGDLYFLLRRQVCGGLELVLFLFISRLLIKINLKILFKMPSTWIAGSHSLRFLFICFSNLYFSFHIHFAGSRVRSSFCDLFMSFSNVFCYCFAVYKVFYFREPTKICLLMNDLMKHNVFI